MVRYVLILSVFGCFQLSAQNDLASLEIVFFQSNKEGSKGHLYTMKGDGSDVQQLGQSGIRPDHYPNWSKDGQHLTFESYRRGGWRIWTMRADGEGARRLNEAGVGTSAYEFDPTYDETGKFVYYSQGGDLFKVDVSSSRVQRITNTPDRGETQPEVSINGDIVFTMWKNNSSNIAIINKEKSRTNQITSGFEALAPSWSPDGSKVLFYSDKDGGFEPFIMNRDGSGIRRLVHDELMKEKGMLRGENLKLDEGWNACLQYKASFSPDGKWVVFSGNTKNGREIFVVSIDGKQLKQLTNNQMHDGFPVFRPTKRN